MKIIFKKTDEDIILKNTNLLILQFLFYFADIHFSSAGTLVSAACDNKKIKSMTPKRKEKGPED